MHKAKVILQEFWDPWSTMQLRLASYVGPMLVGLPAEADGGELVFLLTLCLPSFFEQSTAFCYFLFLRFLNYMSSC